MATKKTIIRIARDSEVEIDRASGILFLNRCLHLTGQIWQVRYYRDSTKTAIDTLIAIGVKNGTGSDSYRVISKGIGTPINGITSTIPDVSTLIHGEIYLTKIDDKWNYVTALNGTLYINEVTGGPYSYWNLEDNHSWYYTEGILRRDDDYYTREEVDEYAGETGETLEAYKKWLTELDNAVFPMTITVTPSVSSGTVFASGSTQSTRVTFRATKAQSDGGSPIDITSSCSYRWKDNKDHTSWVDFTGPSGNLSFGGTNTTITYSFQGGMEEYGGFRNTTPASISYSFGYHIIHGVTAVGSSITSSILSGLTKDSLRTKGTYYSATYTTTLQNLATFAVPEAWGNITKITDSSGVTEYTSSFERIPGSFLVNTDGFGEVSYIVYRWSSLPTVASGFTYRFYH